MKDKIKLEVKRIDTILREETPYSDWHRGKHSALRRVKVTLESILSGETVKLREECSHVLHELDACQCIYRCSKCNTPMNI